MKKNDTGLNLAKLKEMIKNGISKIPKDPNASQAVIVIGDTGVGKSTILSFLSGADLYVRYDGLKPILDCPNNPYIKIGHQKYSQTSIPSKIVIQNIAFYDCPGFKDNKGEQYEISNSFFVQRLLDIYPKVKIVLMIDESHISEARADKLPKLTKNLLASFKTFEDIREGVIMIINRAERDHDVQDYHKQIRKMSGLKNERGFLFDKQQQSFLNYLIDNRRIVLFQVPRKQDKNKLFMPTESDKKILLTIKHSSFVKSKHILNILSESAKLAIRDFIDELTNKSNAKIQVICSEIIKNYQLKVSKIGKDIKELINSKQEVISLAQEIKTTEKQGIVKVLQRQLPDNKVQDFSQDFEAVMFFKSIYDKTAAFFSNLVNKIYSQLSHLLLKMDTKIMIAQKQQQEQLERQRQQQKKRQLHAQRQRQKNEMMMQIKKIEQLKGQVHEMSNFSNSMVNNMGSALGFFAQLQAQFAKIREDTARIQQMNQQITSNISKIENKYLHKIRN